MCTSFESVRMPLPPLNVIVKQFNLNKLPKGAKVISMPDGIIQLRQLVGLPPLVPTPAVTPAAAGTATAVAVTGAVVGAGTDRSRKRTIRCISGEGDDVVIHKDERFQGAIS
jgi:hypothetical protein